MFGFERVELLRGSASMLFGRGSTGGVVNQVSKQAFLDDASNVNFTVGNDGFLRFVGDFNIHTGETSALRVNLMRNSADGNGTSSTESALNYRWHRHARQIVAGLLPAQRQRHQHGLPWCAPSTRTKQPSVMIPGPIPNLYYGAQRLTGSASSAHGLDPPPATAAQCAPRCVMAATTETSAPAPSASASAPPTPTPAWSPTRIARPRRKAWTPSATRPC
jgi:outer membrane receptor protein involved in Fe transport